MEESTVLLLLLLLSLETRTAFCSSHHNRSLFLRLASAEGLPQQLGGMHLTMRHGGAGGVAPPPAEEPSEPAVPELGKKLAQELEGLRQYFATGGEGVPQLDPLHADVLPPIKLTYLGLRANLKLWDVDVRGLQNFKINNMAVRLKPPRIDFDLFFSSLELDAQYKLKASLLLNIITYDPRGNVTAVATGVRASGSAAWDIVSPMTDDGHFALTGFNMALDIDSVELSLTGLLPNDLMNGAMNAIVNVFSDAAMEQLRSQIAGYASDLAADKVNQLLSNYSASYLIRRVAFS